MPAGIKRTQERANMPVQLSLLLFDDYTDLSVLRSSTQGNVICQSLTPPEGDTSGGVKYPPLDTLGL